MSSNKFLKNIHHNVYLDKPLTYRKYICKDCTDKKKEYEFLGGDEVPKTIDNLGYIQISLGRSPIYITTPEMVCPFGFNKENNILTLQFTNINTDNEMKSFYKLIQNLEMDQMKYIGLTEDDIDLYISQIRYDKQGKYDPNLVVKVPFNNNCYDVDIRCKGSTCSVTKLYNFSRLKCDIYIDKIWKYNGKYICKLKVKKIFVL